MRALPVLFILLCLLYAAPAEAQGARCGGARIHWIGGAPIAAFDRGPQDHEPPSVPEPPEMTARDRELWDSIVYDAHDRPTPDSDRGRSMGGLPLRERRTLVVARSAVSAMRYCLDSTEKTALASGWSRTPGRRGGCRRLGFDDGVDRVGSGAEDLAAC